MKRLKLLLAISASVGLLANEACTSRTPPAEPSFVSAAPDALTTPGTLSGVSLRVDLYPAALPGQPFGVEVSFRNSTGQLMNVSDLVTVRLSTNPTAAPLQGTLTRGSVAGVASFPDLTINNLGRGYILTASSTQGGTATSAPFNVVYSEDGDQATTLTAGNSPASARPISPNVPLFRTLAAGDVHYYRFHAKFGQLLTVMSYANRVAMGDWDTSLRLRLLAPDGTTEIARSGASSPDTRGVDNSISLMRIPQEGDYFLAFDADQQGYLSGVYAAVMTLGPNLGPLLQLEAEPWGVTGQNDTPATAQALWPGLLYGHYDNAAAGTSSSDFYKIAVPFPARIRVDLTAARSGAAYGDRALDARLELQDSTGATLWANDNTYGLDPVIDYIVVLPGTYYVRVASTGGGNSPYFLSYLLMHYYVSVTETASNGTSAGATPIQYGAEVSGNVSTPGDHYFAFGGTAGDVVRLVVEDRTALRSATLTINPAASANAVFLAGDGVTELAAGASYGSGTESKLNLRQTMLPASGTYFVRVRSKSVGSFGLRLERITASSREVEPNDSFALANSVPAAGWISGTIGSAGDVDHFKAHAEAGQLVTVSLLAASGAGLATPLADWGSALMPTLEVRNAQGNLLSVTSADRRGESNFAESLQHPLFALIGGGLPMLQTSFRAPASADYDIVVSDADGQSGPNYFYALHVWRNQ